jgi:hypothetical protein
MPATSVAANVALTTSVIAASNSSRAQDTACASMLTSFNSAGSTPAQRQAYAACVERLEPVYTAESEADMKVLAGGLLLAAVAGAVIFYIRADEYEKGFAAFGGAVIGPLALAVVLGLVSLLGWLVS